MRRNPLTPILTRLPLWQATGEGAPAAAPADPAPANAATADGPWYKSPQFSEEEQQWLTARGLTKDNMAEVVPALVKGHRQAEQRLGKGGDSILDRPAKDQPITEWLKSNAANLGLPEAEDGYAMPAPEDWPKDLVWDAELESVARKFAHENGVPLDIHKGYVGLFAEKMKALADYAEQGLATARETMMTDLRKDWGEQTDARVTLAKQAAQWAAQQASFGADQLESVFGAISEKTGDANTIRLFAAIGAAMSEDSLKGLGRGGSLGMTPAEAMDELKRFEAPDGDYGKAFAANDIKKLRELAPKRDMLAKIASS